MKLYIIGEIVYKNKNNVILESHGEGYLLNVAEESRYEVGQKIKMYLYEHRTEYSECTYGFKDFKERLLFIDLLSIEKIGPKIAMTILDKGWEYIARLIADDKYQELSTIQFVTEKMANIICVQLSDKWAKIINNADNKRAEKSQMRDELNRTLQQLGFQKSQIDLAMKKVRPKDKLDDMIEESIKIIANETHELSRLEA
ncbi:Holliday junction branch migration protein RuvA [Mycoplasmopsis verecunda]|uniref:Holliday junction branch migration complex subunit RuvA n=1 Tax=Mycoplasmopsis verecunda TaxID=171291 RepID=A0A1T4KRJ6_9BACT|nr:Holliday junction branch migration protein RuvA [Mycoplasmopsis verecunda]WPB54685.1 Holliday junction branch migration protein RuvA [Mycoplasmopsis verecunda]SJZ45042.1 Holliday junction DNA helicase subunit RuvA [Mycoplasmopsis verecunda]